MRVLVRDASKLEDSVRQRVEVVEGGAESDEDIARAMAVAKVVWFPMHSMGGGVPTAAIQAVAAIVRRGRVRRCTRGTQVWYFEQIRS